MINFNLPEGTRFTYRVAGVCVEHGNVLLHRAETDDFWALPGGRCEVNERSPDTLRREMREEIGGEITVGPLLWVVENLFTHWGRRFHELGLYFAFALPHNHPFRDRTCPHVGVEEMSTEGTTLRLIFQWFPAASLVDAPLYPRFLRTALAEIPTTTQHVINEGD